MNAFGPDVSVWDDIQSTPQKVEMAKAKDKGASFVIIKAAQACYADLDFVWNWADAKTDGLLRASFDFLVWDQDPNKQADFYCKMHEKDLPELGYLLPTTSGGKPFLPTPLIFCDAFCTRVEDNMASPAAFILRLASGCRTVVKTQSGRSVRCGSPTGALLHQWSWSLGAKTTGRSGSTPPLRMGLPMAARARLST